MTPAEHDYQQRAERARSMLPELAKALDEAIGYAPGAGDPHVYVAARRRAERIARNISAELGRPTAVSPGS